MRIRFSLALLTLGVVACGSGEGTLAPGEPAVVAEAPPQQAPIPGPAAPDATKPDGEVDSAGHAQMLPTTVRPISTTIRGLPPITPSEIVGTLTYGVESANVSYANPPSYRAFKFTGAANDHVVATVTPVASAPAYVWIATEAGTTYATGTGTAKATLPASGEYLVVFREPLLQPGTYRARIDLDVPPPPPPPPPPPQAVDVPAGFANVPLSVPMTCNWETKKQRDLVKEITTGLYLETITAVLRSAPASQTFQAWTATGVLSPAAAYALSHVKLTATTGPDVPQSGGQRALVMGDFLDDALSCKWAATSPKSCPIRRSHPTLLGSYVSRPQEQEIFSTKLTATSTSASYAIHNYPRPASLSVSWTTGTAIRFSYASTFDDVDMRPPGWIVTYSVQCTGSLPLP